MALTKAISVKWCSEAQRRASQRIMGFYFSFRQHDDTNTFLMEKLKEIFKSLDREVRVDTLDL